MNQHPDLAFWLLATWILWVLAGPWLLRFVDGIQRKKKAFVLVQVVLWSLFVILCLAVTGDPWTLLRVGPAAAFIIWFTSRWSGICDSCGELITNNCWYSKMLYCSKCGTKLQQ
jgi:hypothetical protein